MTTMLKLAAVAALAVGCVVERAGYVPSPGFALVAGTLVAVYLWFLANTRPHLRRPL
ncbi:MAG: hypothetical protein LAO05_16045 [Acidobacteriia bacterium]|nr:hypothetical protein [Terriglobia bacterium]